MDLNLGIQRRHGKVFDFYFLVGHKEHKGCVGGVGEPRNIRNDTELVVGLSCSCRIELRICCWSI